MADTTDLFAWAIDHLDKDTQRSLTRVASWADSIVVEHNGEEPEHIVFRKGDREYGHLLDDGWDGDDPRDAIIADLDAQIGALKEAARG